MGTIVEIILTGAPGGGKDNLLNGARKLPWFQQHAIIVDEAAAAEMTARRAHWREAMKTKAGCVAFQQAVADRQIHWMDSAREKASFSQGEIELILSNRGLLDGAAYLDGEAEELEGTINMSVEHMLDGTDHVIWAAPSPEEFYEVHNPEIEGGYRFESYPLAVELGEKVRALYTKHHPSSVHVIQTAQNFEDKRAEFLATLQRLVPSIVF